MITDFRPLLVYSAYHFVSYVFMHVCTNSVIWSSLWPCLSLQALPSQEDLSPTPAVSQDTTRTEESFENMDDTQLGKLIYITVVMSSVLYRYCGFPLILKCA